MTLMKMKAKITSGHLQKGNLRVRNLTIYLRDVLIALGLCLLFFLRLSMSLQVTVVGFLLLALLVLIALLVAPDVQDKENKKKKANYRDLMRHGEPKEEEETEAEQNEDIAQGIVRPCTRSFLFASDRS